MSWQLGLDRMPQKGAMRLIDEILEVGEDAIRCAVRDHTAPDYPLRINGRLYAVSLVELGAQAAAAHASLFGIGGHHAGLLLALSGISVGQSAEIDATSPLEARARRLDFDDGGARYRFEVLADGAVLIEGQAMLKMQAIE